jgi:hypothetical protein
MLRMIQYQRPTEGIPCAKSQQCKYSNISWRSRCWRWRRNSISCHRTVRASHHSIPWLVTNSEGQALEPLSQEICFKFFGFFIRGIAFLKAILGMEGSEAYYCLLYPAGAILGLNCEWEDCVEKKQMTENMKAALLQYLQKSATSCSIKTNKQMLLTLAHGTCQQATQKLH